MKKLGRVKNLLSLLKSIHVTSIVLCLCASSMSGHSIAQEMHHQHGASSKSKNDSKGESNKKIPPFIASTAKSFAALMDDAMLIMDDGMKRAPMNGVAEHDFVTMMIPHHQGAVDMTKAFLLYNKDPELQNLAQGILVEQQNEIKLMQAWLQRYKASKAQANINTKND